MGEDGEIICMPDSSEDRDIPHHLLPYLAGVLENYSIVSSFNSFSGAVDQREFPLAGQQQKHMLSCHFFIFLKACLMHM